MIRFPYSSFLVLILVISICEAVAIVQPISDSHRSAALKLFDGSFGSLEETYEALRTFEALGIDKKDDVSASTCTDVTEKLGSSSSKDLFYALKVDGALKCKVNDEVFEDVTSRLLRSVKDASSLLDFYFSIGGLVLVKDQSSKADLFLDNAEGIFRSIKALSQSDGRWRYSASNSESSTFAAGIALETLAGVVSLASSDMDQYLIDTLKNDAMKLFDSIEKYDDGAYYFTEKLVDAPEHQGPLLTSASVVRGLTASAAVTSGSYNIPSEKILGLAKFFLGIGTPGKAKDLFNQVDALACLEKKGVSVPLIVSHPSTVLSLTKKDKLKVRVSTVMGSSAPPLTVKLSKAFSAGSPDVSVIPSQELKYDESTSIHYLDTIAGVDVGEYVFVLKIVFHDLEDAKVYATGTQNKVKIYVTGTIEISDAEISILDSDHGSVEAQQRLNLGGENDVSLSANHLQKMRLSFQLTTLGNAFKPHQVFLKLRHETEVEHIFVIGTSGRKFQIILDFLGLVDKLYYLSGKFEIELTVGDTAMENSFLKALGHIELDLPEAPEKAGRPPVKVVDPYTKFAPKAEISHIFRVPEKRPANELSFVFLGLNFLPLIGFLIGLLRLGVNLKNFPTSAIHATYAILFHGGLAAILFLYVLFWVKPRSPERGRMGQSGQYYWEAVRTAWAGRYISGFILVISGILLFDKRPKLDLFTTLKWVGYLGVFLIFTGHRILSHLASKSAKLKST